MELFKIKTEAKQFFDNKFKDIIKPLDYFKENNISENALQKVEKVYLTYGIKATESITNICRWSGLSNSAQFHFTLNMNDVNIHVYELLKDDELMQSLMDKIQHVTNLHINENLPF